MGSMHSAALLCLASSVPLCTVSSFGQDYPSKPIRIVTSGAGDGNDLQSRLIAQGIAGPLAQQVIVENRPGTTPVETVAKSPPDGYNILVYGGAIWIAPLLRETQWDPQRDLSPITLGVMAPNMLAVHPSLPVKSVNDLIALAKSKPGTLNYSTGSTGGSSHLAGELFNAMAATNLVRIAYKGGSQETTDLIGGYVQLTFGSLGQFGPHVRAGKLRGIAVTSAQQTELFPELPTIAASGLPGYEVVNRSAIMAPAKTPAAIINRLNQEIVRVLNRQDTKEKLLASGVQAVGGPPSELANIISSETAKWRKVIRDANIKAD